MKTKLCLFVISLLIGGYLVAQSNVQIKDVYVSPVLLIDTITNLPVESNGETLAVLCKINELSYAETVRILFGTTQESGDVLTVDAIISESDGIYYLLLNGELTEITDNIIAANIELSPEQSEAYSFITLYLLDVADLESNHLIFTK
ncbi:MAG: hypothetical protein PHE33_12680 [Bacteroidales bacterium]|nr:hypothetical protein [Bacteroidales bacterium]